MSADTAAPPSLEQVLVALRAASVPRLAVTPAEAAELLGVSADFFREHVLADLRVVRRGRKVLVPVRELERWLDSNAALTLGGIG